MRRRCSASSSTDAARHRPPTAPGLFPRREEAEVTGHLQVSTVPEGFVVVGKTGDLAPGEMKFVVVERERVVLANIDGSFYALRDVCGHRNAPLSRGKLIGCLIECPLHFAQFDIRTGKLVDGPISGDVAVYEVRVDGDTVYVRG
jgi:3-phenylpropionate/trans-cinnamate dioxygenase ferredoxin component